MRAAMAILMGYREKEIGGETKAITSDNGNCPQANNCGRHMSRGGDCSGKKEVLNVCPLEDPDFL